MDMFFVVSALTAIIGIGPTIWIYREFREGMPVYAAVPAAMLAYMMLLAPLLASIDIDGLPPMLR